LLKRNIDLEDIDYLAFPWRTLPFIANALKLALKHLPASLTLISPAASPNMNVETAVRFILLEMDVRKAFGRSPTRRIRQVPHHLCHAAGAFFTSPFDDAAVLVMDGYGENVSTSFYHCEGNEIRPVYRNRFFNSMGILYSLVTLHLGYKTVMDEGKVMALASYGTNALVDEFRKIVNLRPSGEYEFDYSYLDYQRYGELRPFTEKFVRVFGPPRRPEEPIEQHHRDLALALQTVLEETVLHTARALREQVPSKNLCFTGGTALNCLTNARLQGEGPFEQIFIPPNPNDSGVALGAALHLYHCELDKPREAWVCSPFAGPGYSDEEVEDALSASGMKYRRCEDVCTEAAEMISQGRVIGWFQGRMEMGPRALGNRSILADPRRAEVRDYLNMYIKRRESYRPYAAAVLEELVSQFFEFSGASPFMSFAVKVRPAVASLVPAIAHCDATSRLQTVSAQENPKFWRLIRGFQALTGVPLVLNTSLNVQEPMVCSPSDALETFSKSGLDALFIEDFRVDRS